MYPANNNVDLLDSATTLRTMSSTLISHTETTKRLAENFWARQREMNDYIKALGSSFDKPHRPIMSHNPSITREVLQMVAVWRSEAREQVSRMSRAQRCKLLKDIGIPDYEREVDQSLFSGSTENDILMRDSSCESSNSAISAASASSTSASLPVHSSRSGSKAGVKRKATSKSRNARSSKTLRKSENKKPVTTSVEAQEERSKSDRKASFLLKPSDTEEDEDEEEEDDQEDQLTAIVRRQREAFSARAAAGRPSARNTRASEPTELQLSGSNAATMARITQANKVLREWKALARKTVCKVARQWIISRREKLLLAKRAARECSRLLRQRALISQKAAKDASIRGHRLNRELTAHWRNSCASIANGGEPLTINGITMPRDISVARCSDYYANGKCEAGTVEGPVVESAAAARRRAERAAAEQRRADLELLEARRQQRKLNFLITQTELYAHFMARKLNPHVASTNVSLAPEMKQEGNESIADEKETARILSRLEESEDETEDGNSRELGSLEDTYVEALNTSCATSFVTQTGDHVCRSENALQTKEVSSSIAVAARAAAHRLGVSTEDEYDIERLKSEAVLKAKLAVERERSRTSQFPSNHLIRSSINVLGESLGGSPPKESQFEAPKLFFGQLKGYQLRGLNWLLGLFDQGINGILADEMGLGKTIQTIAFFGHLAEKYNIWGPFLIVAPASTLHNWTQEFAKFLPSFRLVPYWGSPAERKVLRRFWFSARQTPGTATNDIVTDMNTSVNENSKGAFLGTKEAEMHVVVTSYQIVLQDSKFINKTAWSYIVLDEAHAIKSTSSLRWRLLLSFKCRNRLLLTGTPIQNTMQELWALLHFIMPSLFDSHDEFANWFSRDIESQVTASSNTANSATSSLATSKLNENQLSRLHLILKPFMLRRTKTEVEHEISTKTEITRYCPLSRRQQLLYARLRNKIRLEDLSSVIGSSGSSSGGGSTNGLFSENVGASATAHLINLVMQLRKVCNHPDLWERRDARFSCITGCFDLSPEPALSAHCHPAGFHGVWSLPRLFYDSGMVASFCSTNSYSFSGSKFGAFTPQWPYLSPDKVAMIVRLFAIFHPYYVQEDLWHNSDEQERVQESTIETSTNHVVKCFSFARLMGLSPCDLAMAASSFGTSLLSDASMKRINELVALAHLLRDAPQQSTGSSSSSLSSSTGRPLLIFPSFPTSAEYLCPGMLSTRQGMSHFWLWDRQLRSDLFVPYNQAGEWRPLMANHCRSTVIAESRGSMLLPTILVPKVLLPPISVHISVPYFTERYQSLRFPWRKVDARGIHSPLTNNLAVHLSPIWPRSLEPVPLATRVSDSGKLMTLDALLNELKPAGHRVLIYSQMTRMIDILEEFMIYRKHLYLRLDGSSRLCDRRDMVAQWQTNPRWFVFLLSTRAGGLGINLTAADTVIFYDSDWNPTVDQQAMDRAHRLGQTKPVTVYRLVCKNTVEERMMQRAEEKRAMQQMVIQSGQDATTALPITTRSTDQLTSTDMVSLLLDDEELIKRLQIRRHLQTQRGRPAKISAVTRLMSTSVIQAPCVPPVAPETTIDESVSSMHEEMLLEPSSTTLESVPSPVHFTTPSRKRPASISPELVGEQDMCKKIHSDNILDGTSNVSG